MVPAPCCAIRYINDRRYFLGKGSSQSVPFLKEQQKNVKFYQTRYLDSPVEVESHVVLVVKAVRNKDFSDAFYGDCAHADDFVSRK